MGMQQGAVARVVTETVVTAAVGWLAWCGLVLLLEMGVVEMLAGLVPIGLWAVPTLAVALLLRHRPAGARTVAAGGVAVLWCLVPGGFLVATSEEASGGAAWGLLLILTVSAPVLALVLHGVVAGVLETVSDRSAAR